MKIEDLTLEQLEEGLFCAKLSAASYPRVGMSEFNKYDFVGVSNKETDTQGYILKKDDVLFVVFRGTEKKLRDIITDIMFRRVKVPYKNMNKKVKAHKGFINAWLSVLAETMSVITSYDFNRIVFTGHSLGAVITVFAALHYVWTFPSRALQVLIFNFGQPKPGNKYLANSIDRRIKNYVRNANIRDLVTKVVFWHKHAGKELKTTERKHDIDRYIMFYEKEIQKRR